MSENYDKLVDALEEIIDNALIEDRDLASDALPLARQLIKEREHYYKMAGQSASHASVLETENKRLRAEREYSPYKFEVEDLIARLSEAEELLAQSQTAWDHLELEDEDGSWCCPLHETKARLSREQEQHRIDVEAAMSRLSAANNVWKAQEADLLNTRAHLSVAEQEISRMHNDFAEERQRAEAVVEAAIESYNEFGASVRLAEAIRRWEESSGHA